MLFRHVDEKLMPSLTLELSVYFKDLPSTMFFVIMPYLSSLHVTTTLWLYFAISVQQTNTFSKSAIEILQKGVKYVGFNTEK